MAGEKKLVALLESRGIAKSSLLTYLRLWRQLEDQVFEDPPYPAPDDARERVIAHLNDLVVRGLAPATIRNHLVVARYYFEATGAGHVTSGLRPPLRIRKQLTRSLLPHEVEAIFKVLAKSDPKAKAVFEVILFTGMRLSEFLKLEYTRADVAARRVMVKTTRGKRRPVFLGETAAGLLGSFLGKKRHPRGERARIKLAASLRRAAASCDIPGVTPSRLRATFATRMLLAGHPEEFVAKNLGLDKGSVNSRRRLRAIVADHVERLAEHDPGHQIPKQQGK